MWNTYLLQVESVEISLNGKYGDWVESKTRKNVCQHLFKYHKIYYYCDECFLERTQEGRAIRRCWCSFLRYYRRYLFSSTETMKYRYLSRLCQCIRNAIRRYPPGVATIRPPIKLSLANMTRTG
ncbi:uncharacterized protein LOC143226305 isoform X1 [Tachypleus tridentatus]|uniref:uncharacterized protein LOC143226305 isoform X1 n=1 Tax=Tachypleus tridentatus TaxID=6853 RepID=UPI003FD49631